MAKRSAPDRVVSRRVVPVVALVVALWLVAPAWALAQQDDPTPPSQPVKLIFIHHSCGENWLSDGDGGLGRALGANSYFVSDTNYGWGPDSIGDRTDITDWPEWFTGPNSSRILAALYAENGQLSDYTRTLRDPGGENQIVMFKSCYPNSNLEGSPNDPPARGDDLSVSNAKAIYNELLTYFATRQDKLFIVITAPPVQDDEFAANARAFNTWLVLEWLADYDGNNVAVWDFYNVLTGPDNHHRFRNGAVEYITGRGGNTLAYPTGDDHPSAAGNQKATAEFVPLLNVFCNRWHAAAPAVPPPPVEQPPPAPQPTDPPVEKPAPATEPAPGDLVDGFETGSSDWQVFYDGHSATRLTCGADSDQAYSGGATLFIEYTISADGWASCSLVYPGPVDWSQGDGLALRIQAAEAGLPVTVIGYAGDSPEDLLHFEFRAVTNSQAVDGWQRIDIPWDTLDQVSWQGDGTAPYEPGRSLGLGFSFDPGSSGWLRVDNISLLGTEGSSTLADEDAEIVEAQGEKEPTKPAEGEPPGEKEPTAPSEREPPGEKEEPGPGRRGMCHGSAAIGLLALGGVIWARKAARA